MNLKTYRAYTMAEALDAVKRDLGDDAVILHTRNYKRGGVLGIGRKLVVEVTAATARDVAARQQSTGGSGQRAVSAGAASARQAYRQAAGQSQAGRKSGSPAARAGQAGGAFNDVEPVTDEDRKRTQRLAQAMKEQHERRQADAGRRSAAGTGESAGSAESPATQAAAARPAANQALASSLATPGAAVSTVEQKPEESAPVSASQHGSTASSEAERSSAMPVARRFVLSSTERAATHDRQARSFAGTTVAEGTGSVDAVGSSVATSGQGEAAAPVGAEAAAVLPGEQSAIEESGHATSQTGSSPRSSNRRTVELFAGKGADDEKPRPASGGSQGGSSSSSAMQQELSAIRGLVSQVLQRQSSTGGGGPTPAMPQKLFDMYLKLVGQDVSEELADRIVNKVRDELTVEQLEDDESLRAATVEHLASHVPVADEAVPTESPDDRPLTIALIGPTGVGKTTTLAKLAASFKLRHERRVGLITSDTYRIAAVDQLRTYANIIGLPLQVVLTPAEMTQALHALSDCDVILIDTAGRGQNDSSKLADLQSLLGAARPHEVHLVLSSTASEKVLLREAEAFSEVGADKVVLTKLDEAVSFGMLVNVMQRVGKKLSFVTTGQEVPDHLELGRPDRIAELVLDGEVDR